MYMRQMVIILKNVMIIIEIIFTSKKKIMMRLRSPGNCFWFFFL